MVSLFNLLIWLGILAVVAGVGYSVYRSLRLNSTFTAEVLVLSTGFGFAALIYGTAAVGWVGLLRPSAMYILIGFFTVLAFVGTWRWHRIAAVPKDVHILAPQSPAELTTTFNPKWIVIALVTYSIVFLLSTMAPPLEGDTLHTYLDVPNKYARAGSIIPLEYELIDNLPLNMQMLSTFALLAAGDELAQMLVGFTMAAAVAGVIYLLGYRYLSATAGLLAALFFLTTGVVQYLVPSAKVNLGWAFFDLLGLYALCRWAFDPIQKERWLLVAGIFGGVSFGTHYSASSTIFMLVLFIVGTSLSRERGLSEFAGIVCKRLALYLIPVLLLSGPWLLKNYLETGNPVFPVFNQFFTGRLAIEASKHSTSWLGMITTIWDTSTGYIAGTLGKPIGPVFLAVIPGLILVRPVDRKLKLGLFLVFGCYLLWYLGAQRPRNFLTPLAVLSLVAAHITVILSHRSCLIRRAFIGLFALYLVFNWTFYVRLHLFSLNKLAYIMGFESRRAFLQRTLALSSAYPTLAMTDYINQLSPVSRVVSMYVSNDYYIETQFIDSRTLELADPVNVESLLGLWKQHGITHLFINDHYPPWTLKTTPPEVWLVRSNEFRQKYLREAFTDGAQALYRVRYEEE